MEQQIEKIKKNYKRKRICKEDDEEYDYELNQYMIPKKDNTSLQVQLAAEDNNNLSLIKYSKNYASSRSITTINNDNIYNNNNYTINGSSSQFMEQLNCNYQLVILKQPEETHRARYLSEGSRGSIKDRSGFSHCTIQLVGYHRPTRVEIYVATGYGQIKPHNNYDIIQVLGKTANTLPSKLIRAHDGITCIEVILRPENNMTAILDCIGILKICSYNMKKRNNQKGCNNNEKNLINQQQYPSNTSGSNVVRLVFRAYIDKGNVNSMTVIQTESDPISCVQQLGIPEISKISLTHAPSHGGMDLFIIGKNFDRSVSVIFREYKENGLLSWSAEGTIQKQYLHQCHIICTIPAFHNIFEGGSVSITVRCGNKMSHPYSFFYTPTTDNDNILHYHHHNHLQQHHHPLSKESSSTTTPQTIIKYNSSSNIDNRNINNLSFNTPTPTTFLHHTTSYYNNNQNDNNNTKIECISKKEYNNNYYLTTTSSTSNTNEQRYEVSENETYESSSYNTNTPTPSNAYSNPMWMVGSNNNYQNSTQTTKQLPYPTPTPTTTTTTTPSPITDNNTTFLTNNDSSLYLNYQTELSLLQFKENNDTSYNNNNDFFLNSPSVIESSTPSIIKETNCNNTLLEFLDSPQETDYILDSL